MSSATYHFRHDPKLYATRCHFADVGKMLE